MSMEGTVQGPADSTAYIGLSEDHAALSSTVEPRQRIGLNSDRVAVGRDAKVDARAGSGAQCCIRLVMCA